jgi:hypothetical protein
VLDPDWDGVGFTLTGSESGSEAPSSLADTINVVRSSASGETLAGTPGDDLFLLESGSGHDIVTGFAPGSGDLIVVRKSSSADIEAILGAAVQKGPDVLIRLDEHNSITLKQAALASLSADDFRFAA